MSERDPMFQEPEFKKAMDKYGDEKGIVFISCFYLNTVGLMKYIEKYNCSPADITNAIVGEIKRKYGEASVKEYVEYASQNKDNEKLRKFYDEYGLSMSVYVNVLTDIEKFLKETVEKKRKENKDRRIKEKIIDNQKSEIKQSLITSSFITFLCLLTFVIGIVYGSMMSIAYGIALAVALCFSIRYLLKFKSLIKESEKLDTQKGKIQTNGKKSFLRKGKKDINSFYSDCVVALHTLAYKEGYSRKEAVVIPELIPIGENTILAFLQDPFFSMECKDNPMQFYFLINSMSFMSGVVYAAKWHENYDDLKNGYVEKIIKDGPPDYAVPILKKDVGLTDEQINDLYISIFDEWTKLINPYSKLKDPRDYIFKAMLASYQLGISITLEKLGY